MAREALPGRQLRLYHGQRHKTFFEDSRAQARMAALADFHCRGFTLRARQHFIFEMLDITTPLRDAF